MAGMNKATPLERQKKMMMAYSKNKDIAEMKNEMMDDILEGDEEYITLYTIIIIVVMIMIMIVFLKL
jgi:CHASE3 domain sensor protein